MIRLYMHSSFITLSSLSMLVLLSACQGAEVRLPNSLVETADVYDVSGKSALRWKKRLEFGSYTIDETKKTFPWETETELEFLNSGRANQRFNLEMKNYATGSTHAIVARHDVKTSAINLRAILPDSSNIILSANDNFSGYIRQQQARNNWAFHISDISTASPKEARGILYKGNSKIYIEEITEVKTGWQPGNSSEPLFYGLTFYYESETVGAVRQFNGGKIWISKNIPQDYKDAIAALSSAVILKQRN